MAFVVSCEVTYQPLVGEEMLSNKSLCFGCLLIFFSTTPKLPEQILRRDQLFKYFAHIFCCLDCCLDASKNIIWPIFVKKIHAYSTRTFYAAVSQTQHSSRLYSESEHSTSAGTAASLLLIVSWTSYSTGSQGCALCSAIKIQHKTGIKPR